MDVILVAFKSDGSRKEFRVKGGRCVIGRKGETDLRIPSATVSRQHAEIAVKGAKATVRDLGSSNGTFLNEVRVQEAELAPGDRLSVGPVVFVVQIDGQPAKIQPITSSELPTAAYSDPKSGTRAPISSPLDESSMISGAPAITSPDDSGSRPGIPSPAAPRKAPAAAQSDKEGESEGEAGGDPLSRMISKSKSTEESSVFEFDFFDDEEDEKR